MPTTITDVAAKVAQLIEKSPAGGIFTTATLGPVRTLSENGTPKVATFPVFIQAGTVFDVTITAHRDF